MATTVNQPRPVTIDVETFGIESRPKYPPMPVGVSIKYFGRKAKYYSFGHPTGNNCCWSDAAKAIEKAYANKDGVLFQNSKFDVDVIEAHFGLPVPHWSKIEDTMFLLFLDSPHERELGLKEAATRLLNLPADEQDEVAQWLIKTQPIQGVKISKSKSSDHYFGRYIAFAPGDLVGKYANGDTERTEALFKLLFSKTISRGMLEAYDRERKLMPILLEMERQGLPVDLPRLRQDVELYNGWRVKIDQWLTEKLGDVNFNSGQQLFNAMLRAGVVDEDKAPLTATGKYQTNKDALLMAVSDAQLLAVLKYRTQLNTCLNTFMTPWLEIAEQSNGLIFTNWNQVRAPKGADNSGTRTGRLSSTPNFQNIPNEFKPIFKHDVADRKKRKHLPASPFADLPALPLVRGYVKARDGMILCGRDFSSQELRVLAYFEDDAMKQIYMDDPKADLHQYAADLITSTTGVKISRKEAKTIAFSILYGSGLGKLAEGVGCTVENAKKLRDAYLGTFPGIRQIQTDLKMRAKQGLPIRTWGGREYYCEQPKMIDGRLRSYEYKMLNYVIQGSSADQTKAAIIRFYEAKSSGHLLLTVHDELVIEAPVGEAVEVMKVLQEAMDNSGLDVPMISDGEMGMTWTEMTPCE